MTRILVAGDSITEHYVFEGQDRRSDSPVREGARWVSGPGGATLIASILQELAEGMFGVDLAPLDSGVHNYSVLRPFPVSSASKEQCWRIASALGRSQGTTSIATSPVMKSPDYADIVVCDDADLGFRRWPNRAVWPAFLREPQKQLPRWIVLRMAAPAATGDLWHTIVSGRTQADADRPSLELGSLADRTVLVLSVDELRRAFVRVDGRLSWERAAADVVNDLGSNPSLQSLRKVAFVVVHFGLDGALVFDRTDSIEQRILVFDPAGAEGSFLSGVPGGTMSGYEALFTAAIAASLTGEVPSVATTGSGLVIRGVRAGLNAMRCLAVSGYDAAGNASFPSAVVAQELRGVMPSWSFGTSDIPADLPPNAYWTIIAGNDPLSSTPLWGLARRVAVHGVPQLTGTPYVQFGKLFSVDRSEIESLRSLQRLLTNYRQDPRSTKPLSIAAFGPPGSGKSFGVKQMAEALFGDRSPLEFNLAQFSTAGELHGLFHQIRDRVLQGQSPIVIWDEFDSRDLFWLQYLLAPMQDGTFQDGQITHPIGKCVFVFAGGTRHRFGDFGQPPASMQEVDDERAIRRWRDDFILKKGPDFRSRLAGYINVLGPNRRDDEDITFPVRRALLLRVHLGLAPAQKAQIDPGLLEAFLRIRAFSHGARSLEKIAEQVRLSAAGRRSFTRSDLPPRQLISLHVDADEFLDLVERA